MTQITEDVACTQCGCVCDDLRIEVRDGRVVQAEGACRLAAPWYASLHERQPPAAAIEGRRVAVEDAIQRAADILARSRSPLIYGLSRSSTDGQRAAVALADRLGASIDTTASLCHASSIVGFQRSGESTCSLGEVRHRSDLVVFWGCDPAVSHPRHFERYSVDPPGQFVPRGRAGRTVIVVDSAPSESSRLADVFIPIEPDRDFEALWTLRGLVRGIEPAEGARTGASVAVLRDLAERMKSCRSGVAFFGLGLSRTGLGHQNVEALLRLTNELNRHTRFYARRMRMHGDVTGADSVLCWQTGYPFSVNLSRGYPRYNPGEYSASELLERGEVDACVIVGSETLPQFSAAARKHLERIPTIVLDNPNQEPAIAATVQFTTAIYGVHAPGTAYRMDEMPIPLRAFLATDYRTDAEVLDGIAGRIN